jgi:hypothetical protein
MKGQSKIVLDTLAKASSPLTCRELTYACGFEESDTKNVAAILISLVTQGKIICCGTKKCSRSHRTSNQYSLVEEHRIDLCNEKEKKIDLGDGRVIHITILTRSA